MAGKTKKNGKKTGKVGKGCPPEDCQFKEGNDGGPGRPAGSVSLVSALKRKLRENPEKVDQIVDSWIRIAKEGSKGSVGYFNKLIEHLDGKVPDEKIVRVQVEQTVRVLVSRFEMAITPLLGPDKAKEVMADVAGYIEAGE